MEKQTSGNRVELLHDGEIYFPAMEQAIVAAREEVLIEMYWFGSDRTGQHFASLLMEKAKSGVRVCVIYDAVGSVETDTQMFDSMRAAGCEVHEFHPITPWRRRFKLGLVFRRDHRKMIVIDGRVAITGGVNIGDPWAAVTEGGEGWRDDMIRIEGPAAQAMRELFMLTWKRMGGTLPAKLTSRISDETHGSCGVSVIANSQLGDSRLIRRAYLRQIWNAERYIYIANSYFLPDRVVRQALVRAARRGVDVRLLLPAKADVRVVHYASRRRYDWFLSRGVSIYLWQRSILHSKSAVIDDRWSTVGTYNLDYLSLRFNLEVNVAVESQDIAQKLRKRMEQDFSSSIRLDLATWRRRPLTQRVAEAFFYIFRRLL